MVGMRSSASASAPRKPSLLSLSKGWSGFLKGLVKRGLTGVKLAVSDAHDGLRSRARRTPSNRAFRPTRVHRRISTTSEDANFDVLARAKVRYLSFFDCASFASCGSAGAALDEKAVPHSARASR